MLCFISGIPDLTIKLNQSIKEVCEKTSDHFLKGTSKKESRIKLIQGLKVKNFDKNVRTTFKTHEKTTCSKRKMLCVWTFCDQH